MAHVVVRLTQEEFEQQYLNYIPKLYDWTHNEIDDMKTLIGTTTNNEDVYYYPDIKKAVVVDLTTSEIKFIFISD